ncbi:hypothetical protein [Luteolibacter sp.]
MQAQPLPDAPAPPASEAALLSQKKWKWLWGLGVVSVVLLYLLLSAPMVIRSHRKPDQAEAVSNARQIGIALFEFDSEFGKFPDASTVAAVQAKTETDLELGKKSSNEIFRQLISAEIVQDERIFYAKIDRIRKPDGVVSKGEALKKGECGFSYLAGLCSEGNPSRPLIVTPLIPGTDRFDPTKFDGKAIVLKMNNSVTSMPIAKDGHVMMFGKNLLDPTNPVWSASDKFVITWPE